MLLSCRPGCPRAASSNLPDGTPAPRNTALQAECHRGGITPCSSAVTPTPQRTDPGVGPTGAQCWVPAEIMMEKLSPLFSLTLGLKNTDQRETQIERQCCFPPPTFLEQRCRSTPYLARHNFVSRLPWTTTRYYRSERVKVRVTSTPDVGNVCYRYRISSTLQDNINPGVGRIDYLCPEQGEL